MGFLLLALLVGFQTEMHRETPRPLRTLSVCDVIANDPTKLNGEVIKVRGLLGGTDEGTWLVGECKTQLVTKGLTWRNDLSVYVDASNESVERSWERMGAKLKQLHASPGRDKIWVTIVGRLETRASMDDEVIETSHGLVKLGFGHMNGSPAEINVISVEDVAVESERPVDATKQQ